MSSQLLFLKMDSAGCLQT